MPASLLAKMAAFSLLTLAACANNQAFVTPLAPVTETFDPDCPVVYTESGATPGTETLGIVHCRYTGFGESCSDLAKKEACRMGGDLVYGVHWETMGAGRSQASSVVGTIGRTARSEAAESPNRPQSP